MSICQARLGLRVAESRASSLTSFHVAFLRFGAREIMILQNCQLWGGRSKSSRIH